MISQPKTTSTSCTFSRNCLVLSSSPHRSFSTLTLPWTNQSKYEGDHIVSNEPTKRRIQVFVLPKNSHDIIIAISEHYVSTQSRHKQTTKTCSVHHNMMKIILQTGMPQHPSSITGDFTTSNNTTWKISQPVPDPNSTTLLSFRRWFPSLARKAQNSSPTGHLDVCMHTCKIHELFRVWSLMEQMYVVLHFQPTVVDCEVFGINFLLHSMKKQRKTPTNCANHRTQYDCIRFLVLVLQSLCTISHCCSKEGGTQ